MPIIIPAMWAVWGALVLLFLALKIYAGRLSRDEDDQLVLDDSFGRIREEQATIVAKVRKVEPATRTVLILLCLSTLFVIGYYVADMIRQFQ